MSSTQLYQLVRTAWRVLREVSRYPNSKMEMFMHQLFTKFILIYMFVFSPDCSFENRIFADGEAFPNPVSVCEECTCVSGRIDCHQSQCPHPHCNAPQPGTCCHNNCNGELARSSKSTSSILTFDNIPLHQAAAMLGRSIPTARSFPILLTRAGHAAAP